MTKTPTSKKQHTVWHWHSIFSKNDYFKVGVIHNCKHAQPKDIISIKCVSSKPGFGWETHMRIDEAMTLVAGISKTLTRLMVTSPKSQNMFIKNLYQAEENL